LQALAKLYIEDQVVTGHFNHIFQYHFQNPGLKPFPFGGTQCGIFSVYRVRIRFADDVEIWLFISDDCTR
jgi:hypothetical protein